MSIKALLAETELENKSSLSVYEEIFNEEDLVIRLVNPKSFSVKSHDNSSNVTIEFKLNKEEIIKFLADNLEKIVND